MVEITIEYLYFIFESNLNTLNKNMKIKFEYNNYLNEILNCKKIEKN